MAHIHLEDGTLALFWVAVWWIAAILIIGGSVLWLRSVKKIDGRLVTLAGFCTAALFVVFLFEIPVAGGVHLSMTPLVGILTGPAVGCLIVFIINILAAAIGHGGWSMIGANVLVNVTEVVVAGALYYLFSKAVKSPFVCAATATFSGLVCGNGVMVAIILISGIQGVTQSADQVLAGLSLLVAINLAVAVIESVITGFMVAYLVHIRPDLLKRRDA
ncbi:MAG: energy-coupling factor ABC transporter permease [Methanoregula sp.]|nr:MAG: energy-coupling factor ABC transporter permease [Methanoregula sp.]